MTLISSWWLFKMWFEFIIITLGVGPFSQLLLISIQPFGPYNIGSSEIKYCYCKTLRLTSSRPICKMLILIHNSHFWGISFLNWLNWIKHLRWYYIYSTHFKWLPMNKFDIDMIMLTFWPIWFGFRMPNFVRSLFSTLIIRSTILEDITLAVHKQNIVTCTNKTLA